MTHVRRTAAYLSHCLLCTQAANPQPRKDKEVRATDPADAVTLIPETEDDLGIGLGLDDDGELVAAITVWTTEKGKYVIPLTPKQLGLLMSMSKTILTMDDATVARVKAAWQAEVDRRRGDG